MQPKSKTQCLAICEGSEVELRNTSNFLKKWIIMTIIIV